MDRRQRRGAQKSGTSQTSKGSVRFSAAFIDEVGNCGDIDAFVALMERRGIWLNRNAAANVYEHLKSLSGKESLSDDDLSNITGGFFLDESFFSDPAGSS